MPIHKDLANGRWFTFSLAQQLGNIGSEFERVLAAIKRNDTKRFSESTDRFFELLDLTLSDKRWGGAKLKELARLRSECAEIFFGGDKEKNTKGLQDYFLYFGILANTSVIRA